MKNEWGDFSRLFSCSSKQIEQLELFYAALIDWNTRINLTALTTFQEVKEYHFADSLYLNRFINVASYSGLVDIGTGAGFPGIPLKILHSDLPVVLIEVIEKRRRFLAEMVALLGLTNVEIVSQDWRSFVCSTKYQHNLFCARASLKPEDLMIMFTHAKSSYKKASLVYWASATWQSNVLLRPYFSSSYDYVVGERARKYIVFKRNS